MRKAVFLLLIIFSFLSLLYTFYNTIIDNFVENCIIREVNVEDKIIEIEYNNTNYIFEY